MQQITPYANWRKASEASSALAAQGTQWTGTCAKCGSIVEAVKLVLKVLPFGRGEQWQCKGGC